MAAPAQADGGAGWGGAPNLDTSVWVHDTNPTSVWVHDTNPTSEWLLIDHECFHPEHGLMAVGGRVWDTGQRLLATASAHLCCIPASQQR